MSNDHNLYWPDYLKHRETGGPKWIGYTDKLYETVYSSFSRSVQRDLNARRSNQFQHGAVFNLEFSPDGSILVGATEKRTILVYDALNRTQTNFVDTGHSDCVNCARFLDSRTLATCSDDTTVALWDIRYLKHKLRTLKGHSNWVKNIEYSESTGLLVTSGFDGSIYTWDINSYTEGGCKFQRAFYSSGLMRTKLSPDSSKLVISTAGGYMMIIHDLNLHTLSKDLHGFRPNSHRIMQLSKGMIPRKHAFQHLFTATRNRVEFITDFPPGNDAEMIASLQIHPQGWSVLSRNTSSNEASEWTCVHDIQDGAPDMEDDDEDAFVEVNDGTQQEGRSADVPSQRVIHLSIGEIATVQDRNEPTTSQAATQSTSSGSSAESSNHRRCFHCGNVRLILTAPPVVQESDRQHMYVINSSDRSSNDGADQPPDTSGQSNSNESNSPNNQSSSSTSNRPSGVSPRDIYYPNPQAIVIEAGRDVTHDSPRTLMLLTDILSDEDVDSGSEQTISPQTFKKMYCKIPKNRKRLTHFIEEPNVGRTFIKEQCFSSDGRLVCSPFGFGLRLLAFNTNYSELCDCVPSSPVKLYEAVTNLCHPNVVVSTKFSPTHNLLVSGCLDGQINFHQPVL